jgi:DNA-binding CsgD family transcriptional regulator
VTSRSPPNPFDARFLVLDMKDERYVLIELDAPAVPEQGAVDAWRSLTVAEREVATLAERGLSTRAIAERRGTSPRTVARQLTSIYTKLGARSRRELRALPGREGPAGSGS